MKTKLLLLTIFFIVISCSNENEPIIDNNSIKLSRYSVHFLAGEERIIDILSEVDDFAIYDEDPSVATGWWVNESKSILIKGENVGNTSIYIKDRRNPKFFAEIKVVSDCLSGKFKENGDSANIIVYASDKSIQAIIETDLMAIAKSRYGTLFSFDKENKVVEVDYSAAKYNGENLIGSYEWEKESLTVSFNNNTSKFGFGTMSNNSVTIVLNYLEKYKSKYPNVTITCANLGLFLSSY